MAATQYAFNQLAKKAVDSIPARENDNSTSLRNTIKSKQKMIEIHKQRLVDYLKDPLKHDNRGTLKWAIENKRWDLQQTIMTERVNDLKWQITVFEREIGLRQTRLAQLEVNVRPRVGGGSRVSGLAPFLDVFHIYSMDHGCTSRGGVLGVRPIIVIGPDIMGSDDLIWYCFLPPNSN